MIYNDIGIQFLKAFGVIAIILTCGIVLAIIGIQHEHLTKLRDRKAELEIMIKDLEKKNDELEKELCKYDKRRRKDARKQDNSN